MPELTSQNIQQISRDISREEIVYSHLLDELIDHVCCDVEDEMYKGLSFTEAYSLVKLRIGPDRFRDIQKDTLYAVDFKYRNMKNLMKISGTAGTILLSFGALFKIQHWPLAGVMMTLGAFILALMFLPSSLGVLWKETHNKKRLLLFVSAFITGAFFIAGTLFKVQHWPAANIVLFVSLTSAIFLLFPSAVSMIFRDEENKSLRGVALTGAIGAILYITGMLFKIQHWPFSNILLLLGIFILAFIALPWYTRKRWKTDSAVNPEFIFLVVGCLAIVVPGTLVNLNFQYNYQEGYTANIERQDAFSGYLSENNSVLLKTVSDSSDIELAEKIHSGTLALNQYIDDIKQGILKAEAPSDFLPGSRLINELDEKIREYETFISAFLPSGFNDIVDPSKILPVQDQRYISAMTVISTLDLLKSTILACENAALRSLNSGENYLSSAK